MNDRNVISDYKASVDGDIYNFVLDVMAGRDVLPLTVGFVTEKMGKRIEELTGLSVPGNRIVITADDVAHILKRHGPKGTADQSMKNIEDIARLSYVLANYDSMQWDGGTSNLYRTRDGNKAPQIKIKKRINGVYYVIEVVSDSSKKRNVIITAYLKKREIQDTI